MGQSARENYVCGSRLCVGSSHARAHTHTVDSDTHKRVYTATPRNDLSRVAVYITFWIPSGIYMLPDRLLLYNATRRTVSFESRARRTLTGIVLLTIYSKNQHKNINGDKIYPGKLQSFVVFRYHRGYFPLCVKKPWMQWRNGRGSWTAEGRHDNVREESWEDAPTCQFLEGP